MCYAADVGSGGIRSWIATGREGISLMLYLMA